MIPLSHLLRLCVSALLVTALLTEVAYALPEPPPEDDSARSESRKNARGRKKKNKRNAPRKAKKGRSTRKKQTRSKRAKAEQRPGRQRKGLCTLGPVPNEAYPIDPGVRALFKSTQIIDGTLAFKTQTDCCKSTPAECQEPDAEQKQTCYRSETYSDFRDITRDTGINIGSSGYNDRYGAWIKRREDQGAGIKLILTSNDLDAARADQLYGNLMYIQTWDDEHKNKTPENLATHTFNLGLRIAQLAYNQDSNEAFGTTYAGGADQDDEPLPDEGVRLAKALMDNFVLLDVSHVGTRSALEIIRLARKRKLPVIANHANAQGIFDDTAANSCRGHKSRNHSDKVICAIARSGGVLGITPIRFMLASRKRENGVCRNQPATENDFIQHLDYVARGIKCRTRSGKRIKMINHVGVGSDGAVNGYNPADTWLHTAIGRRLDRWLRVASRLKRECGYSKADLAKIFGLNFERAYRRGLPGLRPPVIIAPNKIRLPLIKLKRTQVKWLAAKVNSPVAKPIPAVTGYKVTLQRQGRKRYKTLWARDVGNTTSYTLGKLKKGTYRVRVTATNGEVSVRSGWRVFRR